MMNDYKNVLIALINRLYPTLIELSRSDKNDFIMGELTAYVEVLETIQFLDKEKVFGLDFDIEEVFPIVNRD